MVEYNKTFGAVYISETNSLNRGKMKIAVAMSRGIFLLAQITSKFTFVPDS